MTRIEYDRRGACGEGEYYDPDTDTAHLDCRPSDARRQMYRYRPTPDVPPGDRRVVGHGSPYVTAAGQIDRPGRAEMIAVLDREAGEIVLVPVGRPLPLA